MRKSKLFVFLAITIAVLLFVFIQAPVLNPMYFEGAFFWATVFTAYVLGWVIIKYGSIVIDRTAYGKEGHQTPFNTLPKFKLPKWAAYTIAIPWLFIFVFLIISSPLISWKSYRDQLGVVETKVFSSDVQAVDLSKVPIVDKELAKNLADKKLGQRPSLGSQVYLGEPTIQMVNEELLWVVPLQHSGFFMWLTNMSGTPGYITVSATNVNDVEYVEGHKIKYQPNCYLFDDLLRYARFTAAPFKGITDYSFEIDDSGNPYWAITSYKNLRGFSLSEADGVILINATTGERSFYSIENVPEWVDRVQPEDYVMNQINNQGNYVHGIFNFANKDKFEASQGDIIVYNQGECYLFTGLTSVGGDESAIGFMMVNMVTKETYRYSISGATEYSAMKSAEGKVQHLRYQATFPLIINVSDQPTYFMTLKDNAGLIKQYAFVSVTNYSTVGTGETIQAAMADYEKKLRSDGTSMGVDKEELPELTHTGKVLRIASEFDGTKLVYKALVEGAEDRIFIIPAELNEELALTQSGDSVTIKYNGKNNPGIYMASSFDNNELKQ